MAYITLCAIVAVLGRNRALGATGFFMLAFFLSPITATLVIMLGRNVTRD